tara:strand:- start:83 stop:310 length:228 start_codon:yes stop_codon:yes gene_type:complete
VKSKVKTSKAILITKQRRNLMLTIVYITDQGANILLGAFLMPSDAKVFMDNSYLIDLKTKDVQAWEGWSVIRDKM